MGVVGSNWHNSCFWLSQLPVPSNIVGESVITEEMLIGSFKNYVSVTEMTALDKYLSGNFEESDKDVIELLSNFDCKKVINRSNITSIITEIAHKELIQGPEYVAHYWRRVLALLKPTFPLMASLNAIYDELLPSNIRVIEKLKAVVKNDRERDSLKHLKRYIRGLDSEKLAKFLHFVSGSELMLFPEILVTFTQLEGIAQRPIAHTCNYIWEISSTYQSFPELREEFNGILAVDNWEIDKVQA